MLEVNQQDPFARDSGRDRGSQSAPRMHGADRGMRAGKERRERGTTAIPSLRRASAIHGRTTPDRWSKGPHPAVRHRTRTPRLRPTQGLGLVETQTQVGLRIATRMGEPVTLVMTRRMLHGIRQRAERSSDAQSASGQRGRSSGGRLGASPSPSRVSVVERGGRRLHHVDSTQTTDQVLGCRPRSFDGASHAGAGSRPKGVPPGMLLSTQGTAPM